ncbi:L-fucose/L-arabinose isomerase family protein [Yeguia hominis]|uniref:L-fucose/L-arabinose isomerase family protein n=1 Tax=Yeguia hominis TaxID=2763662 RepID=A0A926D9C3_9FIRM|nr:L-fucose/L-arabinose isomerase family protein [Yeguia hominis]MBC8533833.1 L-fucose/L-arabinose isomerase family protein [Yeguia hominis]
MQQATIKLGFAPTRRSVFSAPDAVKYANLTRKRLRELQVDFVDIAEVNADGLLYDEAGRQTIEEKFRAEKIDGLFVPHCNFGTEYEVARLAKALNVPVLLWGPRDEAPESDGSRLRDSQCGMFATGKVLRRFGVPFTYLKNCRLKDAAFAQGIRLFQAVCNVVRTFRNIRILQIAPRPFDFWSTMCNEGELLEKFGVQLSPVPMPELLEEIRLCRDTQADAVRETVSLLQTKTEIQVTAQELETIAALTVAMKRLVEKYGCSAVAVQCWNCMQTELGIMPCTANAILTDMGIPVACETDIHGAISSLLVQAASMGNSPTLFCDWTVRHPHNENAELLQHCGPWPISLAKEKPVLGYPIAFDYPGSLSAEYPEGTLTIARFDGDNGEYSLLLGNAEVVPGPYTKGTYLWIQVENLDRLEAKLVCGPYIHHCLAVYQDVLPVLYEACKYIGVQPDLYDPVEEQVKAVIRGEKIQ